MEFIATPTATLINSAASDDMVAMAAWVSQDRDNEERLKEGEKIEGLINFLYRNKHMSPFEHGVFTWKIDCPLFVRSEFHRHRTWSYNEVSGRYTQMKPRFFKSEHTRVQQGKIGNYSFVPATEEQDAVYLRTQDLAADFLWDLYLQRLDSGMAMEKAREILPMNLMTQFYATANPRNVMQFLSLRTAPDALEEIRIVADSMYEDFKRVMPLTAAAYEKYNRPQENEPVESKKLQTALTLDTTMSSERVAERVRDILSQQERARRGFRRKA